MNQSKLSQYDLREKDWRFGAIVYQVIVDRFAPSKNISSKKHLYAYPRRLKSWDELPKGGAFLEDVKYWSHELDFWGGDLESLRSKLDYIKSLDVDVIYLNPICESLSNHKYDATNYLNISTEFGTKEDLKQLIQDVHGLDMKIMLDGVFNHVGVQNELYLDALKGGAYKHFFDFNKAYPEGVRLWADVKSLPELNLEHEDVKKYIYKANDSVIKSYLNMGVDGWRLDVAFDIGYNILKDLTDESHQLNPHSMIIGEIWNYPKTWLTSIDGVMNFTLRELIFKSIRKEIPVSFLQEGISHMIEDCGIEGILKSWNLLDNHDVARLKHMLPNVSDQRLAQVMQFMLPGSPNVYYGTELGMDGGFDPMNRAPMDWKLNHQENEDLKFMKTLIGLRKVERALRIGDYRKILSQQLFAFERHTDHVKDTVITIMNLTDKKITESLMIYNSDLMNYSEFDIVFGEASNIQLIAGILQITLTAKGFVVIKPHIGVKKSYTSYKRIV